MPREENWGHGQPSARRSLRREMQRLGLELSTPASVPGPILPNKVIPFIEHPRVAIAVALFSLAGACVLTVFGVRMKNLSLLFFAAWIFCIPAIVILCGFLPRFRKAAMLAGILLAAGILYYGDIHNPAISEATVQEGGSLVHNQGTIGTVSIINSAVIGHWTCPVFGEPKNGKMAGVEMNHVLLEGITREQFLETVEKEAEFPAMSQQSRFWLISSSLKLMQTWQRFQTAQARLNAYKR